MTLKGSRYPSLIGLGQPANRAYDRFVDLVGFALKTARAWHHRSLFTTFWEQPVRQAAKAFFALRHPRTIRSRLKPMAAAARAFKQHLGGAALLHFSHQITNALSEAFNSRIEAIKNSARGSHRFSTFRIRILFHLGDIDLEPCYSEKRRKRVVLLVPFATL